MTQHCIAFSANSSGEVWVLERGVFQHIMMASGLQKLKDRIEFLKTVPLLADHKISEDQMLKLSDAFDLVGGTDSTEIKPSIIRTGSTRFYDNNLDLNLIIFRNAVQKFGIFQFSCETRLIIPPLRYPVVEYRLD